MNGPSPAKRLSMRHQKTQEIVHEWVQGLPYPLNQQAAMRENALMCELNLHIQLLLEAAWADAKEEQ